ncbi:unnamed protein product [Protopolystoma xenopodis]|uniref:Uncharacterized protein n=1 Tax=Protopolystoma xenopodis TaxID=117903 RepID=A0A3S5CVH1_9PLAT|nr:unnamed protein product [Protopolystoma xenopodis]
MVYLCPQKNVQYSLSDQRTVNFFATFLFFSQVTPPKAHPQAEPPKFPAAKLLHEPSPPASTESPGFVYARKEASEGMTRRREANATKQSFLGCSKKMDEETWRRVLGMSGCCPDDWEPSKFEPHSSFWADSSNEFEWQFLSLECVA